MDLNSRLGQGVRYTALPRARQPCLEEVQRKSRGRAGWNAMLRCGVGATSGLWSNQEEGGITVNLSRI